MSHYKEKAELYQALHVAELIARELKEALRDAINECSEHNKEYHHITPDYKLKYWESISKEI